jgi:hypothetical protein
LVRRGSTIAHRKPRLELHALEDRIVLDWTPVPFDYVAPPGSYVRITSSHGEDVEVSVPHSDGSSSAHFESPPEPDSGLYQGYWGADVVFPPGWRGITVLSPFLNNDGQVYNALAVGEQIRPDVLCDTGSCPPTVPGAAPQTADGNDNGQPAADAFSDAGVRYYDGVPQYEETDLSSGSFGFPWGQARSWSQDRDYGPGQVIGGYDYGQHNGTGWVNDALPVLRQVGNYAMDVAESGKQISYFHPGAGGTWVSTLSDQHTLAAGATGEIALTDEVGNRTVFYDYSAGTPVELRGQFKRYEDCLPSGKPVRFEG